MCVYIYIYIYIYIYCGLCVRPSHLVPGQDSNGQPVYTCPHRTSLSDVVILNRVLIKGVALVSQFRHGSS